LLPGTISAKIFDVSLYVIGHKNPDTDSVASAIGYAELLKRRGKDAVPLVCGEINKGTVLALKKFELKAPEQAHMIDFPEASVVLVDHNEEGQWADNLIKEHVVELIDHHRFGDFSSAKPIYVRTQPVGATSSIVSKMYQECGEVPSKQIAGLLLSAILTDTLMFNSPTTTDFDKEMANWLNNIARINMAMHARAVFTAKSDITGMSLADVINKDFKEFHFNSRAKVGIAMFETVDAAGPLDRKNEFIKELRKLKSSKKLDFVLFAVVDIANQISHFIIPTARDAALLDHVFGGEMRDDVMAIDGLVSRKKQIVPPLEEYFANHDQTHIHEEYSDFMPTLK
jgi:manganese-dependent inorganic pyrophosphatase